MFVNSRAALACLFSVGLSTAGFAQDGADRKPLFGELHIHTGWSFDAYVFGVRATPDDAYETGKLTPPSASANRLRRTTNRNHTINPINGHGLIQNTRSWRITACSIPFDIHITGLRHLINPL